MVAINAMKKYYEKEALVFSKIPGVVELLTARAQSNAAEAEKISMEYPDASFVIQISDRLFEHDREMSLINQRAYLSILNETPISEVRRCYDRDFSKYVERHTWDD